MLFEPRWPIRLAIAIASGLSLTLPDKLVLGPVWVLPAVEFVLLIGLMAVDPFSRTQRTPTARIGSLLIIALLTLTNIMSLALLIHHLLAHGANATGKQLIFSSIQIWLINVIAFALWFWELDGGGPSCRSVDDSEPPDFLFPQMISPDVCRDASWRPLFADYAYLSFTNANGV